MTGMTEAVSVKAAELVKRAAWIEKHHWTFDQYDKSRAGDLAFQQEYLDIVEMGRKHRETPADG